MFLIDQVPGPVVCKNRIIMGHAEMETFQIESESPGCLRKPNFDLVGFFPDSIIIRGSPEVLLFFFRAVSPNDSSLPCVTD